MQEHHTESPLYDYEPAMWEHCTESPQHDNEPVIPRHHAQSLSQWDEVLPAEQVGSPVWWPTTADWKWLRPPP